VELLKVVFGANNKNTVVSPVSVSTLLSLIQQGSGGNTEAQLTQVLHLDPQQSRQGYRQLTRNLKESSGNVTLEFANAAFLKKGFPVKTQFGNILEQDFQATIHPTDFNNGPSAANEINSWVGNKTHDKIKNLVSPGLLRASTILVLVNAIYFKGFWKTPFQKSNTRNDNFFVQPNSPKEVPTMHMQANLLTGSLDALDSRWLQLPFEGDRFYLLIILPNAQDGVHNLVNNINGPEISDLISNLESRGSSPQVVLSVPKFKLETTLKLVPALQELGLTDMFTPQADLRRISQQPLLVSEVVQKAHIEVDEEGATAAAASGAFIVLMSIRQPPPLAFSVDHPFIAIIVDDQSKIPLFVCKVTDPTAA
jgi:serpin B